MCQDRNVSPGEEIQYPILHMPLPGPELVDPIAKKICRWASELVTELPEHLNSHAAISPRFLVLPAEGFQPFNYRCGTVRVPKENNLGLRHPFTSSLYQYCY